MSTSKSGPFHRDHKTLIRSTSLLSLGTLISRILGFGRDILLAQFLGTKTAADAFFVAFKIPNLLRSLIGEGASDSALVPVFMESKNQGNQESLEELVSGVFVIFGLVLIALTVIGIILTPLLVRLVAPGFITDAPKLALTIELTRWMFPYVFFVGLTAVCMGLLYAYRFFFMPAISSSILNVALMAAVVIASGMPDKPVLALAVGLLAGGVLQLGFHLVALKKIRLHYRWPKTFKHPGIRKIGRLLLPRVFGSGVYQINVLLDTFCASLASVVGQGGVSAIYYANRIVLFPVGIFGVSLASALLPDFSHYFVSKNLEAQKKVLHCALKAVLFVMMPSTMLILLFARPVVVLLYERGAFDAYSSEITSSVVWFYALGLVSFAATKVLVTVFHSLQDTRTPVKAACVSLIVNGVLNVALMFPLKTGGIALASAIAGGVNVGVLMVALRKRINGFCDGLWTFALKVTLVTGVTGALLAFVWPRLPVPLLPRVFLIGVLGTVVYLGICAVLKVNPFLPDRKCGTERIKR